MKKTIALLLMLLLFASTAALADAPAPGSLALVQQTIRGNASWTPESYPEIWITPFYSHNIIEGKEKYPADFLRFALPEGAAPVRIEYDYCSVINFDTLVQYSYQAMDRYAFELFLEKAEPENTLSDGSDGVALYIQPDNRRGRSLIDLAEPFGGTAKMSIEIYDHTGDLTGEELSALITAETARVLEEMQLEKLDHFWSQNVFSTVELYNDFEDFGVTVDTSNMTLIRMQDTRLVDQTLTEDGEVRDIEVQLSKPYRDDMEEKTLADGTPYLIHSTDYTGDAFFLIGQGKRNDVYLEIKIEAAPDDVPELLEAVYALVTLPEA